ncbi:hypothetical protein [Mycolicibacterium obuense]|uniref:Uncharacterized protein n=1 Tax=Mycolicibacterium obuense TaxID=1807 RepID=A0A0J6WDJ3_9MYCO|nr:hypothetical protein [Mycolicibacterium obuense]KMO81340.1 hypothetical protein MOBUDSM44075_00567 [Mycolicibacterium obuense]
MNFIISGSSDPVPAWLQWLEAIGQALGAVGVVIALIAFAYQWYQGKDAREQRAKDEKTDRDRHEAQLAAFRQAEDDRLAAQARRVLVAPVRANVVNPSIWNVTINNWAIDAITIHNAEIIVLDQNGQRVSGGWRLADRVNLAQSMINMFYPEFSAVMDALIAKVNQLFEAIRTGAVSVGESEQAMQELMNNANMQISQQTADALRNQVTHALTVNFTDEWPSVIGPGQFAAMAIHTTKPDYQVHVYLQYEDAFGYIWERTDQQGPKRLRDPFSQQS